MFLFFDTETTGLPANYNAPVSDTMNWPRMVELAFRLYQEDGTLVESGNHIVKPDGYIIPVSMYKIHGITTERASLEGLALSEVLTNFENVLAKTKALVAHNLDFDEKILGCEFYRSTKRNPLTGKQKFCTMKNQSVINYCAISSNRYGSYKWPKLSELHFKLFGSHFKEAHHAEIDINATAKCFWELKRIGKI